MVNRRRNTACGFLAQNPSVGELCERLAASDGGDDGGGGGGAAQQMDMEAVFGLRSYLCWWIIRNHIGAANCGLVWADMMAIWRTNIFIFMAGMTLGMQYDRESVPLREHLKTFVPFLPAFFVAELVTVPVNLLCERNADGLYLGVFVFALLLQQSTLLFPLGFMGHFTCCFNPFRALLRQCRLCECGGCCDTEGGGGGAAAADAATLGCCLCGGCQAGDADRPHPTALRPCVVFLSSGASAGARRRS